MGMRRVGSGWQPDPAVIRMKNDNLNLRLMDYLERACHSATANDLFRLTDDSILPERILRSKGHYGHSLFPF